MNDYSGSARIASLGRISKTAFAFKRLPGWTFVGLDAALSERIDNRLFWRERARLRGEPLISVYFKAGKEAQRRAIEQAVVSFPFTARMYASPVMASDLDWFAYRYEDTGAGLPDLFAVLNDREQGLLLLMNETFDVLYLEKADGVRLYRGNWREGVTALGK